MREAPQHSCASQIVRFADFEVDLRGRELRRNGARIPLQEQPLQVLAVLLKHAGEVVTREELCQHLWPSDTFVDFDNSPNSLSAFQPRPTRNSPCDPAWVGASGRAIAQLPFLEARLESRPQPHRFSSRASLGEPLSRLGPGLL